MNQNKNYFLKLFNGDISLSIVFWFWFIFISLLIEIFFETIFMADHGSAKRYIEQEGKYSVELLMILV